MKESFYNSGLKFSCKKCSHCCRGEPGYVYLSKNDLNNLISVFSVSKAQFISLYCRWVPYYDGSYVLCLKEKDSYDCILWKNDGCSAYQMRPVQCKTYPFWTHLMKDKNEWENEKLNCPGIDCGKFHSKEEIKASLIQYELNLPYRKSEFEESSP
ncbi:MAG: YkgJ family cysteine cluster protein [Treponemataceae bacterium]